MLIEDRTGDPGKNVIVLATCNGWLIRTGLLGYAPFFRSNAVVHYYPNYFEDISPILPKAAECDLFIYQPERDPGLEARVQAISERMPPSGRIVRFPTIGFTPFWPYLFRDWNAPVDPELGGPRYALGDRRIVTSLRDGMTPARAAKEYLALDVAAAVDLDRLYELWRINAQQHEADCDAPVSDLIDAHVRERMLFFSSYHCANFLVFRVLDRILDKLGLGALDPAGYEAPEALHDYELPIHPSVIRHFGIKYLDDDYRYKMYSGERISFEEYFERYGEYVEQLKREAVA